MMSSKYVVFPLLITLGGSSYAKQFTPSLTFLPNDCIDNPKILKIPNHIQMYSRTPEQRAPEERPYPLQRPLSNCISMCYMLKAP